MIEVLTVPFTSAAEAWIWTMQALVARREGGRVDPGARPCEPDDVVKVLDRLYRNRRITLQHARVLRVWGERGLAPDDNHPGEARLWTEATHALDWPLRVKGIVKGGSQ
ncbi:MAG: hypothetical protein JWR10_436 [Rubritepida sp.]|nr:hypothetical protein [Rubritepida sp.]